jgi:hypothetical protein
MPHARKPARLVQDAGGEIALSDIRLEELQRNRMIQPGVVGVEDFTKGPLADLSAKDQMAPSSDHRLRPRVAHWCNADVHVRIEYRTGPGNLEWIVGRGTVLFRNVSDDAEVLQEAPARIVGREAFETAPVDRVAVGYGFCKLVEGIGILFHPAMEGTSAEAQLDSVKLLVLWTLSSRPSP